MIKINSSPDFSATHNPTVHFPGTESSSIRLLDPLRHFHPPLLIHTVCLRDDEASILLGNVPKERLIRIRMLGSWDHDQLLATVVLSGVETREGAWSYWTCGPLLTTWSQEQDYI